jgi:hypothetical protein
MQDRPDATELLSAVARFLLEDLQPQITDKAQRFRLLIAANLLSVVRTELTRDEADDQAQLQRLAVLLPGEVPTGLGTTAERHQAILSAHRRLCQRLRTGEIGDHELLPLREHVRATLREKLAVVNPRFDTAPDIE